MEIIMIEVDNVIVMNYFVSEDGDYENILYF